VYYLIVIKVCGRSLYHIDWFASYMEHGIQLGRRFT